MSKFTLLLLLSALLCGCIDLSNSAPATKEEPVVSSEVPPPALIIKPISPAPIIEDNGEDKTEPTAALQQELSLSASNIITTESTLSDNAIDATIATEEENNVPIVELGSNVPVVELDSNVPIVELGSKVRNEAPTQILRLESDVEPDRYKYTVETSDGKAHHEEGMSKDVGSPYPVVVVKGFYTHKDEKTGQIYTVHYVADEFGYRPVGDHLPQQPNVDHALPA